jgi:hypothetical protein
MFMMFHRGFEPEEHIVARVLGRRLRLKNEHRKNAAPPRKREGRVASHHMNAAGESLK